MIRTIPLNKLVTSPRNVRRRFDEQADRELKADIEARGLLQNLVVTPAGKPRGTFAVEAGERRRRSLFALAEEGKLAKDFEVCCLVLDDCGQAHEASLAENFQRLAMNPADECLAFQQLIEHGAQVEDVARRFGLTIRFVDGRLRLAGLAPEIFDALGAGEISLDVAKAYAAIADRERQLWVFEQVGRSFAANHPDSIRRMITQATVGAKDRRALLVGEEAYVVAGGRIERDLFSEEGAERWLDVALLERLAGEKMEALASQKASETGLAFVRPTLESWVGHSELAGLRRVQVEAAPLSDDEAARIASLEAEVDQLVDTLQSDELYGAARADADAKVRALSDEIESIAAKPPLLDDAARSRVGTFLVLDDQGRPRLHSSFYAQEADEGARSQTEAGEDADLGVATSHKGQGLSQRLVDELSMQRRDILAVHVAADPALALDLAIFLMIDREASGYSSEKPGSSLIASPPSDPVFDFKAPTAAATLAREKAGEALDRSWAEGSTLADRFDAFRALAEEDRAAWLGHAVARTLEASLNLSGARRCPFHDHLAGLLGIEVARWWRPTGTNFFDRVPKSVTLAALEEIGGGAFAARYATAKKAELSQACERIFAGEFIGEVEVKEAALGWLPEAMRFRAGASPATDPADESEGSAGASPASHDGPGGEPELEPDVEEAA